MIKNRRSSSTIKRDKQVVRAVRQGKAFVEAAEQFDLSVSLVEAIYYRTRTAGEKTPFQQRKSLRDKKLVAAVRRGRDICDLATEGGIGVAHLKSLCREQGTPAKRLDRSSVNVFQVIALLQQGRSQAEIARLVGLTRQAISHAAKMCCKHGVQLDGQKKKRPKGPAQRREE